ncbi:hypothetical protein [Dyella nitratireducens]|uniref:Uncharacterized protein n=2 Tax=Dyella nitratireducens TaxID=1849580 RepID=A0ABQ1FWK3_9GAMM|nr:hypothetical protein [Dyella nitratireducens]GGA29946.1 hypothetical protein GCM10010981_18650 [Dyella nitratireducens]GLQ43071.1 hypothetical protein GCM10007902_29210 [Dyella nitratireducens]
MDIDLEAGLHPTVHKAISALQVGDKLTWLTCFTASAKLFDNGKRRGFHQFSRDHVGMMYFTTIEHVDRDGRGMRGWLHLGDDEEIVAYFKFRIDTAEMCSRLDVSRLEGDRHFPLLGDR